jgi:cobaltochelatase CobS
LDKNYIWPRENTELAVVALLNGDKSLVIGPTGSGKSSLIRNVCAVLQIPFVRINFFNQVEYSSVFGMPKIIKGELKYADGPIVTLGRHGGVLCLDEFSSASSDITMSLQYPLEDGGQIYLPDYPADDVADRMIDPHQWFRLVATDNTELQGDTTGKHAGTNVQNTATLDRFQTVIRHEYLDKRHERSVLTKAVPNIPKSWVDQMLQMADLIRKGYNAGEINLTMSPRTLINWARKAVYWG